MSRHRRTRYRRGVRWSSRWDAGTHRELTFRQLDLPDAVSVRWTGATGFLIACGADVLAIDPYLRRLTFGELVGRHAVHGDPVLARAVLRPGERLVGVAVGHTHFDHALDAPTLVEAHRCPAFGSTSLQQLLGLHGLAGGAVVVEPHRRYEVGPFTLRFVPSRHAKLVGGVAVPSAGELTCEHLDALTGRSYRCGDVFGILVEVAGTTIYHQGSADFVEDEVVGIGPVDVFLAGIAGRSAAPRYFPRVLRHLDPRQLVPTHYDHFLRPLAGDLAFLPGVHLDGFVERAERLAPDATLVTLDPVVPGPSPAG
jgi:L-ascorbate metabolism protein UlaG (beta-lactamase superfamily)